MPSRRVIRTVVHYHNKYRECYRCTSLYEYMYLISDVWHQLVLTCEKHQLDLELTTVPISSTYKLEYSDV